MKNLAELWQYQQADMEYDKFEGSLRDTPTFKQLTKLHSYLEEQKKVIARLTEEVEQHDKAVKTAQQQYDLVEKRFKEGLQKYEDIDKNDIDEVVRFRKYFEKLGTLVASERKEFSEMEAALTRADAQFETMRKNIGPARKEYQDLKIVYDKERAAVADQLEESKKQLQSLEKNVDKKTLERYKSVKRSTRMPVVKVIDNQCGGCMMQLSAVLARRLKESDEIIECENCGRILYQE